MCIRIWVSTLKSASPGSSPLQSWVGQSVQGGCATLAARSAPCQTPGCSSLSAHQGWSWCGCSGLLRRIPGTQQFADGISRSHRRSAPPAPGLSPWQQSEWAGGRHPLGKDRRRMSELAYSTFRYTSCNTQIHNYTYRLQPRIQHLQMEESTTIKNVLLLYLAIIFHFNCKWSKPQQDDFIAVVGKWRHMGQNKAPPHPPLNKSWIFTDCIQSFTWLLLNHQWIRM